MLKRYCKESVSLTLWLCVSQYIRACLQSQELIKMDFIITRFRGYHQLSDARKQTNLFVIDSSKSPPRAISGASWFTHASLSSPCSHGMRVAVLARPGPWGVPWSAVSQDLRVTASCSLKKTSLVLTERRGWTQGQIKPTDVHHKCFLWCYHQVVISFPVCQTPPFLSSPLPNKDQRQTKHTKKKKKKNFLTPAGMGQNRR